MFLFKTQEFIFSVDISFCFGWPFFNSSLGIENEEFDLRDDLAIDAKFMN